MYRNTQTAGAQGGPQQGPGPEQQPGQGGKSGNDEVTDVDFEEVK
jgi:molecular chaperone DnaK